jgi:hypothetical protein
MVHNIFTISFSFFNGTNFFLNIKKYLNIANIFLIKKLNYMKVDSMWSGWLCRSKKQPERPVKI